jgi:hypothetical protein
MTDSKPATPPSSGGGSAPAGSCVGGCPKANTGHKWLDDALNIMCPKDKAYLDDLRARGVTITAFDRIYWEDPYYDGTRWTTKHFEGGGSTSGTDMNIVISHDDGTGTWKPNPPADVAQTIYHEGIHTGQPTSMSWRDKEYEAYTKSEQWCIDHGLPESFPGFRKTDGSGKSVPDTAKIKDFVDKEYPIAIDAPVAPGGPQYKVIGKDGSGNTIIQNVANPADVKTRPPKAGDTFPAPNAVEEPPGGYKIPPSKLKCP